MAPGITAVSVKYADHAHRVALPVISDGACDVAAVDVWNDAEVCVELASGVRIEITQEVW
jgi:hypothetical protein